MRFRSPARFQQRRQLSHDGVRPRRHHMRALRERERLLRIPLLRAHGPERLQCPREIGVDVQDTSELCLRLVEPPEVSKPARIMMAIQEVQRISCSPLAMVSTASATRPIGKR